MDILLNNWEYVAIGILVIDKIVALSPSKNGRFVMGFN